MIITLSNISCVMAVVRRGCGHGPRRYLPGRSEDLTNRRRTSGIIHFYTKKDFSFLPSWLVGWLPIVDAKVCQFVDGEG